MINRDTLVKWLESLPASPGNGAWVAIDEGGLTLVELDENDKPTGNYLEVGGIPTEDTTELRKLLL